jgi:hypothetical protein
LQSRFAKVPTSVDHMPPNLLDPRRLWRIYGKALDYSKFCGARQRVLSKLSPPKGVCDGLFARKDFPEPVDNSINRGKTAVKFKGCAVVRACVYGFVVVICEELGKSQLSAKY